MIWNHLFIIQQIYNYISTNYKCINFCLLFPFEVLWIASLMQINIQFVAMLAISVHLHQVIQVICKSMKVVIIWILIHWFAKLTSSTSKFIFNSSLTSMNLAFSVPSEVQTQEIILLKMETPISFAHLPGGILNAVDYSVPGKWLCQVDINFLIHIFHIPFHILAGKMLY